MGLTTERKIFLGLMVVAGGSLIVDQAILSPSSAQAAPMGVDQIDAMTDEPILASTPNQINASVTQILNNRLSKTNPSMDPQNASNEHQRMFAPLATPKPQQLADQSDQPLPMPDIETNPTQQIPTNLPALSAVMPSHAGNSGAILNAKLYRIGDATPEGYRLISVQQRKVLVEFQSQRYWLSLPIIAK